MVFWDKLLAVDSLDQLSELLTRTRRVSDKSSSCFHWLPWDQQHLLQKADKGLGQRFSLGVVLPPRRHLAIAGIFRSPDLGWGCCWRLVGGGQGTFQHCTVHRTTFPTEVIQPQVTAVLRLGNLVKKGFKGTLSSQTTQVPTVHHVCQQLWSN